MITTNLKFAIGIQARSGSTRLPMKCLRLLNNTPMWVHSYELCSTVLPTTMLIPEDDTAMIKSCKDFYAPYLTGPENSPLKRYQNLMETMDLDYVVRVTSDCPLINRYTIADMVLLSDINVVPYLQNEQDGMDVQIIRRDILFDKSFNHEDHVVDIAKLKARYAYHRYDMHLSVDKLENFQHIEKLIKGVK